MNKFLACIVTFSLCSSLYASAPLFTNLLQDASFEALTGNEPDFGGSPWSQSVSAAPAHIALNTTHAHTGDQSVGWHHYTRTGFLEQQVPYQIEAGRDYVVSMWMKIDEQSTNADHHGNPTTVNLTLATSTTQGGEYGWIGFGNQGTTPTVVGEWQYFEYTATAEFLEDRVGEWLAFRIIKDNQPSEHRLFVDDVGLTVIPEPGVFSMLAFGAMALFGIRRRLVQSSC